MKCVRSASVVSSCQLFKSKGSVVASLQFTVRIRCFKPIKNIQCHSMVVSLQEIMHYENGQAPKDPPQTNPGTPTYKSRSANSIDIKTHFIYNKLHASLTNHSHNLWAPSRYV